MKPVDQTRFGPQGNCYQACLASLFELPLEAVPDFCHAPGWPENAHAWLREALGLGFITIDLPVAMKQPGMIFPAAEVIAAGPSVTTPGAVHAVLARVDTMPGGPAIVTVEHDPNPASRGGRFVAATLDYFVVLRPGRMPFSSSAGGNVVIRGGAGVNGGPGGSIEIRGGDGGQVVGRVRCGHCAGTGQVITGPENPTVKANCPDCDGTGTVVAEGAA